MSQITKVAFGSLIVCIITHFQTQKQQSQVSFKLHEAKRKFKTSLDKPSCNENKTCTHHNPPSKLKN